MANISLPDLTARTATADTDLIHVNSGGTDYKQTKANFLADYVSEIEFNSTSALTTQVDALPVGSYGGAYTGKIASYGHQSETGVPENDNYSVEVSAFSTQNKRITIMSVLADKTYTRTKLNGTWGSWILVPRREEITSLNNSLTNSLTSSFVPVTAKTNFVVDTNNTRRIGNVIVVYVKGHTTGSLTNGELFEVDFTDSVKNGSSTFAMGVGGTWNIDGVGYAYFNASSKTFATNTNWSGKYLHINYVIVLG